MKKVLNLPKITLFGIRDETITSHCCEGVSSIENFSNCQNETTYQTLAVGMNENQK